MKNIRYKLCILLAISAISISACGKSESSSTNIKDSTQTSISETEGEDSKDNSDTDRDSSSQDTVLDEIEAVGDIEVNKNIFSVKLTIPEEFIGETTQEELDKVVKEKGYKSAKLNKDGSVKYVMTKKQHNEMMKLIEESLKDSLDDMIGSEDYPNITNIEYNDDYTNFVITTTSSELSLTESTSVLAFYMYGGMYNIFNGTTADNIHIEFINADSGKTISSSNSKDQ